MSNTGFSRLWPYDLLFLLFAAFYAWLCWNGIAQISAHGAVLDSDLQTYAQGMAGAAFPGLFVTDPAISQTTAANAIPNLQRFLALLLVKNDNWGLALLKAGVIAIFCFYAFWYIFGRWLFHRPVYAFLCALTMGVTVWIGWGTFWGVTHSDPVPRVFYAAIFPLLLLLALIALNRQALRYIAMFLTGCSMWIHGVSALNCGAMFYLFFLLYKPAGVSLKRHLSNSFFQLAVFLAPVLCFLYPSLFQGQPFSENELNIFKEMAALRWRRDFQDFFLNLKKLFNPSNPVFYLFAGGFFCWIICLKKGSGRIRSFDKFYPAALLALLLTALFSLAEGAYAAKLNRLAMGHELVRGFKFIVPLSWLAVIGCLSCFSWRFFPRLLTGCVLVLYLLINPDRQYVAAQYAFGELTGIRPPLWAQGEKYRKEAESWRAVLEDIKKIVPEGELVMSAGPDMAIRFISLRPLLHTFKDGYIYYYNKDFEKSREWLKRELILRGDEKGLAKLWRDSGARWLLIPETKTPLLDGNVKLNKHGLMLLEKPGE